MLQAKSGVRSAVGDENIAIGVCKNIVGCNHDTISFKLSLTNRIAVLRVERSSGSVEEIPRNPKNMFVQNLLKGKITRKNGHYVFELYTQMWRCCAWNSSRRLIRCEGFGRLSVDIFYGEGSFG